MYGESFVIYVGASFKQESTTMCVAELKSEGAVINVRVYTRLDGNVFLETSKIFLLTLIHLLLHSGIGREYI